MHCEHCNKKFVDNDTGLVALTFHRIIHECDDNDTV